MTVNVRDATLELVRFSRVFGGAPLGISLTLAAPGVGAVAAVRTVTRPELRMGLAEAIAEGDLLVEVEGQDVRRMELPAVFAAVKARGVPVRLGFERRVLLFEHAFVRRPLGIAVSAQHTGGIPNASVGGGAGGNGGSANPTSGVVVSEVKPSFRSQYPDGLRVPVAGGNGNGSGLTPRHRQWGGTVQWGAKSSGTGAGATPISAANTAPHRLRLEVGDLLLGVGGRDVSRWSLRDVFELMKGEPAPFVARFRKGPGETLGAAVAAVAVGSGLQAAPLPPLQPPQRQGQQTPAAPAAVQAEATAAAPRSTDIAPVQAAYEGPALIDAADAAAAEDGEASSAFAFVQQGSGAGSLAAPAPAPAPDAGFAFDFLNAEPEPTPTAISAFPTGLSIDVAAPPAGGRPPLPPGVEGGVAANRAISAAASAALPAPMSSASPSSCLQQTVQELSRLSFPSLPPPRDGGSSGGGGTAAAAAAAAPWLPPQQVAGKDVGASAAAASEEQARSRLRQTEAARAKKEERIVAQIMGGYSDELRGILEGAESAASSRKEVQDEQRTALETLRVAMALVEERRAAEVGEDADPRTDSEPLPSNTRDRGVSSLLDALVNFMELQARAERLAHASQVNIAM